MNSSDSSRFGNVLLHMLIAMCFANRTSVWPDERDAITIQQSQESISEWKPLWPETPFRASWRKLGADFQGRFAAIVNLAHVNKTHYGTFTLQSKTIGFQEGDFFSIGGALYKASNTPSSPTDALLLGRYNEDKQQIGNQFSVIDDSSFLLASDGNSEFAELTIENFQVDDVGGVECRVEVTRWLDEERTSQRVTINAGDEIRLGGAYYRIIRLVRRDSRDPERKPGMIVLDAYPVRPAKFSIVLLADDVARAEWICGSRLLVKHARHQPAVFLDLRQEQALGAVQRIPTPNTPGRNTYASLFGADYSVSMSQDKVELIFTCTQKDLHRGIDKNGSIRFRAGRDAGWCLEQYKDIQASDRDKVRDSAPRQSEFPSIIRRFAFEEVVENGLLYKRSDVEGTLLIETGKLIDVGNLRLKLIGIDKTKGTCSFAMRQLESPRIPK